MTECDESTMDKFYFRNMLDLMNDSLQTKTT